MDYEVAISKTIVQDLLEDVISKVVNNDTAKERKGRTNKRNERKRCYNFGEDYINKKGNPVGAKSVREGCNPDKCKRHCKEKINQDQRNHILKSFWALGEHQKRWNFISKTVKIENPKQRRVDTNNMHKKTVSRKYMFEINGSSIMVCKQFYLDTLAISNNTVITALDKVNDVGFVGSTAAGGPIPQSPHYLNEEKAEIKRHIESFPTVESHYCRKKTTRKYLAPTLTVPEMYRLYKINRENEGASKIASLTSYRYIFNNEYSLSFHKPKKDRCTTCSVFDKNENKSEMDKIENAKHREEADEVRKYRDAVKKEAQEDCSVAAGTFDLEEVLPLPKSEDGDVYYYRQLNNYNLSIYGYHDGVGHNYLWNETIAHRGSSEIASCVAKYLEHLNESGKIKCVKLLSDSCGGQNRNRPFLAMLWWAAQTFDFEEIHHTFFVRGHSENESDSIHSRIERASKHIEVFTTNQWATVIQGAKKNKPFYVVNEMVSQDFLAFKKMTKDIPNMNKSTDRENINYLKIRTYSVRKGDTNVSVKSSMLDSEFKQMNLLQSGRRSSLDIMETVAKINPVRLHNAQLGIDRQKSKNLVEMCEKGIIPLAYHCFYKSLPIRGEGTNTEESEEDSDSD